MKIRKEASQNNDTALQIEEASYELTWKILDKNYYNCR